MAACSCNEHRWFTIIRCMLLVSPNFRQIPDNVKMTKRSCNKHWRCTIICSLIFIGTSFSQIADNVQMALASCNKHRCFSTAVAVLSAPASIRHFRWVHSWRLDATVWNAMFIRRVRLQSAAARSFSKATKSLLPQAKIICRICSASGGQNSKTSSWTLATAVPKISSSWISWEPSSENNLCLNLEAPTRVASDCFMASADCPSNSSEDCQRLTGHQGADFPLRTEVKRCQVMPCELMNQTTRF